MNAPTYEYMSTLLVHTTRSFGVGHTPLWQAATVDDLLCRNNRILSGWWRPIMMMAKLMRRWSRSSVPASANAPLHIHIFHNTFHDPLQLHELPIVQTAKKKNTLIYYYLFHQKINRWIHKCIWQEITVLEANPLRVSVRIACTERLLFEFSSGIASNLFNQCQHLFRKKLFILCERKAICKPRRAAICTCALWAWPTTFIVLKMATIFSSVADNGLCVIAIQICLSHSVKPSYNLSSRTHQF